MSKFKTKIKCKVCQNEREEMNSAIKKTTSLRNGCCSFDCFKKTQEYLDLRKESDVKRVANIKNSEGGFRKNGLASKITRAKNFLSSVNIDVPPTDNDQLLLEFKKAFSIHAGHGEKIKLGRETKYPDIEDRKKADQERVVKGACNMLGIVFEPNMSLETKKEITKKAFANFRTHDKKEWKLKHLLNVGVQITDFSNVNIDRLYTEYLSRRFKRNSIESEKNGYTCTEKGWYVMTNSINKFFYRSYWEKKVFEALDLLLGEGKLLGVVDPERIPYVYDGIQRHYYPDASFICAKGRKIVLEIKPHKKCDDPINVAKFCAARSIDDISFHVLTEVEIFQENIKEYLEMLA